MNQTSVALFLSFILSSSAFAQPANPYNGTWTVSFDGNKTADLEGTVVVDDGGGTWKVTARARKNPCVGREAPITVQTASPEELVFEVNRSKVLTGCKDWTMKFKKVDDKTLTGEFTDGRAVSLIRN